MGRKVSGLLVMILLYMLVSSSSIPDTLPSDLKQETPSRNSGSEGHGNGRNALKENIKRAHGFGHGASNGGGSTGSGENGNSGGSGSPNTRGGSNFIPVYAAGAANNRHQNHHGAGNSNRPSHIVFSSLVAASIASLVYLMEECKI